MSDANVESHRTNCTGKDAMLSDGGIPDGNQKSLGVKIVGGVKKNTTVLIKPCTGGAETGTGRLMQMGFAIWQKGEPMSDLISRQAAIDAFYKYPNVKWTTLDVLEYINDLPSAQPVIRCKDCKWFRKEYGWNCIEYTVCVVSPTHHPIRREEDFCSYAERKEQDDG